MLNHHRPCHHRRSRRYRRRRSPHRSPIDTGRQNIKR